MKTNYQKTTYLYGIAFIGMAACSIPATSFAETPAKETPAKETLAMNIGLGVASVPDYEGSDDNEAVAMPQFNAKWSNGRSISLFGNRAAANAIASEEWKFGPVLHFQKNRDSDVDDNIVSKMRKIDSKTRAGAFVGFNSGVWDVGAEVVTDMSNDDVDDGGLVSTIIAGYTYDVGNISTRTGISTTYADDDYMQTYFGVDADNSSRSGLAMYNAQSGMKDFGIDVSVKMAVNDRWDARGFIGYKVLLNDAKDSPLVDNLGDNSQFNGGIVGIYKF